MNPTAWVHKYRQLYYGWKMFPAAWGMLILAGGIHQHGFNIFILPIKEGLALTSAQAALVFSLARAEGGAEGPIAGWLIDRFGTRRLIIGGILLSAAGYYLFSFVLLPDGDARPGQSARSSRGRAAKKGSAVLRGSIRRRRLWGQAGATDSCLLVSPSGSRF